MTVLKKAGIVVAGSAAVLLAVSPLAFAGDKGHGHEGGGRDGVQVNHVEKSGSTASGLIALGEINALNNINVCPPIGVGVALGDVLGLLGPGTATANPSNDDTTCVVDESIDQDNDD
ncbi:hypothetical protein ACQEVB_38075 [Pseudonocardia sp. CA-107938]|uniref:hypothetical protein n=1 Tax=Pseudonocardia sp. CA-107938 TaxID=3240021 RepID=UPI003D907805